MIVTGNTNEEDVKKFISDDQVQAVFVCSTTGSHHAITRIAIECGKSPFVYEFDRYVPIARIVGSIKSRLIFLNALMPVKEK